MSIPLFFRPPPTHAEGHLEVTTIVVVVIDIYLYDYYYYYYLYGRSGVSHGLLLSGSAAPHATVALASREEVLAAARALISAPSSTRFGRTEPVTGTKSVGPA